LAGWIDIVRGGNHASRKPAGGVDDLWGCLMSLSDLTAKFVAFVRKGYPHGVRETDYIPLLALLRR
jgi:hypothetical protein